MEYVDLGKEIVVVFFKLKCWYLFFGSFYMDNILLVIDFILILFKVIVLNYVLEVLYRIFSEIKVLLFVYLICFYEVI